jgi:hypothetical protein
LDDCRSPSTGLERRVVEFDNIRRARQDLANGFALNSDPTAMNDAEMNQAQAVSLFKVRFDRTLHVARSKRMQIEYIRNRYFEIIFLAHAI